jgi:phospholipid/cholesterol/gamma-HCH transport system permease protein
LGSARLLFDLVDPQSFAVTERFTLKTTRITALPDRVGLETLKGLAYVGGLARLTGESAWVTFVGPFRGRRLRPQRAIHQAMAVGVEAVPIVSLISFFVGLIIALQSAYELGRLGAIQFVADAVAISVVRELGPLITAIIVIGRSGSAFAAEIGTMEVTEEVDALETMAIRPVAFLVAPKFLAMLVMVPCLTIWADFMGVMGGCLFGVTGAHFTLWSYLRATRDALLLRDIVTGLVKSALFAVVITAVGCKEGFSTGAGAEEIGRSTTAAVVTSIFLVIAVDLVFTVLFYLTSRG